MILGLVATESIREIVHGMNFRNTHDIRNLDFKNTAELLELIESQQCFTHILVDMDAVPGNSDDLIQLIYRLRQSTTVEYLILLEGFPSDSRVCLELRDLGIEEKNLIFSPTLVLKHRLTEIFYQPTSTIVPFIPPQPFEVDEPEILPEQQEEISSEPQPQKQTDDVVDGEQQEQPEQEQVDESEEKTITPPSQITTVQAYAALQERMLAIQKENLKTAATIAIAGAGSRIGTTTQALQILMYLRMQHKAVALVEMHSHSCLESYASVYSDAVLEKDCCIINGNQLYFSDDSLSAIQKEYEYLVLDFGDFQSCKLDAFMQSDIRVISCGIKPWETEKINNTFRDNDGTFRYLFSFVPVSDEKDVSAQMEEYSKYTFFAPYSPDMFQYNGKDDLYAALVEFRE